MSKTAGQPGPFARFLIDAEVPIQEKPSVLSDATFHSRMNPTRTSKKELTALGTALQNRRSAIEALNNYRFFVSPSGLVHELEKPVAEDDELPTLREEAINVGLICHKVLEWEFTDRWPRGVKRGKSATLQAGYLFDVSPTQPSGKRMLNDAQSILTGFYASAIFKELKAQKILGCEVPFFYPLAPPDPLSPSEPVGMHGIMDLVYEQDGKIIVADYKTSRVPQTGHGTVSSRYAPQGAAYQQAVRQALGRNAVFELLFLRTNERVRL
jgi:ATP-dependent exoDNAse (exonuclease V) beta subunit